MGHPQVLLWGTHIRYPDPFPWDMGVIFNSSFTSAKSLVWQFFMNHGL